MKDIKKMPLSELSHAEKLSNLDILFASLIHEISNPLNALSNNTTMLVDNTEKLLNVLSSLNIRHNELELIKDDFPEMKKSIAHGIKAMKAIIENLKLYYNSSEEKKEPVDINKSVDDVLVLLYGLYKNTITIEKKLGNLPTIPVNKTKIHQVLLNIILNAIQAIKNFGKITIKTSTSSNNIIIEISDTGSGIEKKDIEKIYEPHFTTKSENGGTGLGLYITKKILDPMGAKILVESESKKGTKVVVEIPFTS